MKSVALLDIELTYKERSMLSAAFKNVVGCRRASLRIVQGICAKEKAAGNEHHVSLILKMEQKITAELFQICEEILQLLRNHMIPSAKTDESLGFYYKLVGDYHRYMWEASTGELRKYHQQQLDEAYSTWYKFCTEKFPITDPILLGLALSHATFYYEILNEPEKACELAKKTFDDAISQFDKLSDKEIQEIVPQLQLLRDNLTLWTSGNEDEDE